MTKKAQIIIIILCGITVISVVITANLKINNWLNNMRQDAFDAATNRVVGSIFAGIERNGEVTITIPDGNGDSKKLILVAKAVGSE